MVKIYASWSEGLCRNKKALKILKDSRLISGVETCELDGEIDLIKEAGLDVNIHNPLRRFHIGLEDRRLKKEFTSEKIKICKKCDEDFIGFHSYYKNLEKSHSLIIARIRHILNVLFLRKVLNKKIIFESPPYYGNSKIGKKASSPGFIKQLIKYSDGYLFDVSHNFITLKNFEKEGFKDYSKEIFKSTRGKVLQVHLNCPIKKEGEYFVDGHLVFSGKEYEKEALNFTKGVIKNNPQLKVLTLEMTTNTSPEEHARILVNQVRYLKKELKLI